MDDTEETKKALAPLVENMRARRYDAAIAGLKRFLLAHPSHEIALGLLASAYFQIGMTARAKDLYQELLAAHPANPLARFQLGMVYFTLHELERALETWQPLLATADEFMARFHSALVHLQLGDQKTAAPLLEEAAANMPAQHPLYPQLQQMRQRLAAGPHTLRGYSS